MNEETVNAYVAELEEIFTGPFGVQFEPRDPVSEIIENKMYIGNAEFAQDCEKLEPYQFTHIVNCISDKCKTNQNFYDKNLSYSLNFLGLTMRGDLEYDLAQDFDVTRSFLNEGWENTPKVKIFIHCNSGMSRSVSIALAFMIQGPLNLNLQDACCKMRIGRFGAGPNNAFMKILIREAHRIDKLAKLGITDMPFDADFRLGSGDEEEPDPESVETPIDSSNQTSQKPEIPFYIKQLQAIMFGPSMIEFDPENQYDEIIPGLYLGESSILSDKDLMKDLNFSHIINCSKQFDDEFDIDLEFLERKQGIKYMEFEGVNDPEIFDLKIVLEKCTDFIHESFRRKKDDDTDNETSTNSDGNDNDDDDDDDDGIRKQNTDQNIKSLPKLPPLPPPPIRKVTLTYVCCENGAGLSAAIIAAYLMKCHEHTLKEAISILYEERNGISIKPGFLRALRELEISLPRYNCLAEIDDNDPRTFFEKDTNGEEWKCKYVVFDGKS